MDTYFAIQVSRLLDRYVAFRIIATETCSTHGVGRFTLFVGGDADVIAEVVEDGDVVHLLFSFVELLLG